MASKTVDITLLGFTAVNLQDIKAGDVAIFRSTSIAHDRDLPLQHGRTCRVLGVNRFGKVEVAFKDNNPATAELEDPKVGKRRGLTPSITLAPVNLITKNTPGALEAAQSVHKIVQDIVTHYAEVGRPQVAQFKVKTVLGEAGMYDNVGKPAPEPEDLPF